METKSLVISGYSERLVYEHKMDKLGNTYDFAILSIEGERYALMSTMQCETESEVVRVAGMITTLKRLNNEGFEDLRFLSGIKEGNFLRLVEDPLAVTVWKKMDVIEEEMSSLAGIYI